MTSAPLQPCPIDTRAAADTVFDMSAPLSDDRPVEKAAGFAVNGEVRIRYEVRGPVDGDPLLLLLGVGMQLVMWHEDLLADFVGRGFRVAILDYRDCGESTHLDAAGRPTLTKMMTRPSRAPYTLRDMADDVVAVLDELGWAAAHIVGMSMGGMIAQELAIHHRERVSTLTSMMATPTPSIGRISMRTGMKLTRMQDREVRNREDAGEILGDVLSLMGSPGIDDDLGWVREAGARAYDRAYDQAGRLRQEYALMAGGDRRTALATLDLPVTVIHGDADAIWKPSAGQATAEIVKGARLVMVPGMGHGLLPRRYWPLVVDEVCRLTGH
ncbi:alpha/beta fold hydrolase [Nocardia tengchongensis]|uniref:alpha/beta fold hydrolase n=1 Tax=Nocardia tengchongensis TaxID=2055889 RepID=UPI003693DFA5